MRVLVVVGPTGVGKTKMGVELAKALNGEVISGDSMQIYKGMDIGTAKVTQEEMDGVIHHCVDILEPTDTYSVKDFQDTVRAKIKEISEKGKLPIIVGGTGLYIKAALYDYEFKETKDDHSLIQEKYKDYDNVALYNHLLSIDKKSAEDLHPNNRRRVLRAIEIFEETGEKKSEILEKQEHVCLYDAYFIGLTLDREVLYERINLRVDIMARNGLEQEVTTLLNQYDLTKENQSMKAIGYKEWFDYFENRVSKEEMYELIKQHSRQYAKRQYTWFKNQFDVHWYYVNLKDFNETVQQVLEDVKK